MALCDRCGWDNPPTARFCANRDCGGFLGWQDAADEPAIRPNGWPMPPLSHEPFQVSRESGAASRVHRTDPDDPPAAGRTSAHGGQSLFVVVPQHDVSVTPGSEASVPLRVRNTGGQIERAVVETLGFPNGWVTMDPPFVNLDVNEEATVVVRIRPPRLATTRAGRMAFSVVVWSASNPHVRCAESRRLTVAAYESVMIRPAQTQESSRGRRAVAFRVAVENHGNTPVTAVLHATPGQGSAWARCVPERVTIAPDASAQAVVTMRPRHRHIVGPPTVHTCVVAAEGRQDAIPATLTLRQPGRLPQSIGRLLPPLIAVALILAGLVGRDMWEDRARTVPDVVGTTEEDAVATLEDARFEVVRKEVPSVEPGGEVLGQQPPAGEEHRAGTTVNLEVSEGPPEVSVPEVRGLAYEVAVQTLHDQGFVVVDGTQRPDLGAAVTEQEPKPGSAVAQGSEVTLFVASPP